MNDGVSEGVDYFIWDVGESLNIGVKGDVGETSSVGDGADEDVGEGVGVAVGVAVGLGLGSRARTTITSFPAPSTTANTKSAPSSSAACFPFSSPKYEGAQAPRTSRP